MAVVAFAGMIVVETAVSGSAVVGDDVPGPIAAFVVDGTEGSVIVGATVKVVSGPVWSG